MRKHLQLVILFAAIAMIVTAATADAADKKLGVMWIGDSGVANSVSQGLIDGLKEKAPEIDIDVHPAVTEEQADELFNKWQTEKDGVVFLRSTGAEYLGSHENKVPGFCGACTNPVILGVTSSLESPDKNATGVTYYIPASEQLNAFQKILPDAKSICLLVEAGHPASPLDQKETKEWCEANGVEYHEVAGTDQKDVLKQAKQLESKVDYYVVGNETLVMTTAKPLSKIVKKPMFSLSEKPLTYQSAAAGFASDSETRGRMLADSVIEVLVDGKAVSDVPVKTDKAPKFKYVPSVVEKYELTIPQDMMTNAEAID